LARLSKLLKKSLLIRLRKLRAKKMLSKNIEKTPILLTKGLKRLFLKMKCLKRRQQLSEVRAVLQR